MLGIKVTYIKHSGVLVETEHCYLLFDYWTGELPPLKSDKKLYIFSSHIHRDHFVRQIFKLEGRCKEVEYILSFDIERRNRDWKRADQVHFMRPYEVYETKDCKVETLKSTDEGVAFIVEVEGHKLYHAGDLHMWYWPGDPDHINERRKQLYYEEMEKIKGRQFDLAFVVLDPRQEYAGGWGMDYFLQHVSSKYVFPIHWWEDYQIMENYKAENDLKYITSHIMKISYMGEQFEL